MPSPTTLLSLFCIFDYCVNSHLPSIENNDVGFRETPHPLFNKSRGSGERFEFVDRKTCPDSGYLRFILQCRLDVQNWRLQELVLLDRLPVDHHWEIVPRTT